MQNVQCDARFFLHYFIDDNAIWWSQFHLHNIRNSHDDIFISIAVVATAVVIVVVAICTIDGRLVTIQSEFKLYLYLVSFYYYYYLCIATHLNNFAGWNMSSPSRSCIAAVRHAFCSRVLYAVWVRIHFYYFTVPTAGDAVIVDDNERWQKRRQACRHQCVVAFAQQNKNKNI